MAVLLLERIERVIRSAPVRAEPQLAEAHNEDRRV
jgi:hypothetical protein